jgi:hypothetical protein
MENENEKEENLEEFASQALRLHRKGSFEFLLSQHLAYAVGAEPMQKVRLICEAAYMVPSEELEKADVDQQLVETLYRVALSLSNSRVSPSGTVRCAWSFQHTRENFNQYIAPWIKNALCTIAVVGRDSKQKEELMEQFEFDESFWILTSDWEITLESFQILKAEFLSWALPKAMEIFEKLSRLVDPQIYREIVLKSKGEQENANSLG